MYSVLPVNAAKSFSLSTSQHMFLSPLGPCPAPMAVGETARGKSTCLQLIQWLLGGSFLSQSSGESVSSELVRSTLPVCWDDPAHPNTLKKVLVSTFQGGGKQTKGSGNELPLTTFLITVNFTLDDDIRFVDCNLLVWYIGNNLTWDS